MSDVVAIFNSIDPWKRAVEDQQGLLPAGYTMSADDGTWYTAPTDKAKPQKVCDAVVVKARVCDPDGGEWGRVLEYRSPSGGVAVRLATDELLHDTPRNLAKNLAASGLWIDTYSQSHTLLQRLLNGLNVAINVYVKQGGWTKNLDGQEVFALPSGEVVGGGGVIVRPDCCNASCLPSGTLQEWQHEVAKYAIGNSRLILSMSAQLAAPLLKDSGMISGGFHLWGESQSAKTTALLTGCTLLGRPTVPPDGVLSSWNSTANAMEGTASRANDCAMPLDEMSQAAPNDVAKIIYQIGNGAGKGRMRADSSLRSTYSWRTLVVSTGEEKAEDILAKVNKKTNAGVDVRLANVPADAGVGHGVFEELHGFSDFNALARHLVKQSRQYYGTGLREFVAQYCLIRSENKDEIARNLNQQCDQWVRENVPQEAAGQVKSVARRFALCAVAGEMGIGMGVLPWPVGTASGGVKRCMDAWLEDRGDVGMAENKRIILDLQRYLTANQYNRFVDADVTELVRVQELVGIKKPSVNAKPMQFRDDNVAKDFFIFTNQWQTIMPGTNVKTAMKLLREAGYLVTEANRPTYTTRLMWKGSHYTTYRISNKIFEFEN